MSLVVPGIAVALIMGLAVLGVDRVVCLRIQPGRSSPLNLGGIAMKASRMIVGEKYKVGVIVGTYVRMNGKMIVLENNGTEVHANPNDKIKKYTGETTESLYTNKYPCKACGERKLACEFRRTKNGGLTRTCLECLYQAQSRNARNRWKNKKQEESK